MPENFDGLIEWAREVDKDKEDAEAGLDGEASEDKKKSQSLYRRIVQVANMFDWYEGRFCFVDSSFYHYEGPKRGWVNVDGRVVTQGTFDSGASFKTVRDLLKDVFRLRTEGGGPFFMAEISGDMPQKLFNFRFKQFDIPQGLIPHTEGLFDPKTKEVKKWAMPIWGPVITAPLEAPEKDERFDVLMAMLNRMFPDPEILRWFQKQAASVLLPNVTPKQLLTVVGGADTGKTTMLTALATCPGGVQGFSLGSLRSLAEDKFQAINLYNKFVNLSDDGSSSPAVRDFVSGYTGGTWYKYEHKFEKPFSAPSTAKLWVAANRLPFVADANGDMSAMLTRMKLFNVATGVKIDNPNEHIKDRVYWAHPTTRAKIFEWLCEGLLIDMSEPVILTEEKEEALESQDLLVEFLRSRYEISEGEEWMPLIEISKDVSQSGLSVSRAREMHSRLEQALKCKVEKKKTKAGLIVRVRKILD